MAQGHPAADQASTTPRPAPSPAHAAAAAAERARASVPQREEMTGAQSLIRSLEAAGVDTVFGIPGGAILPAYDPLMDSTQLRHILVRHEQGAGHAAQGYAQTSGKVGVCMRPPVPVRPTSSPRSPTRTWTPFRWSRLRGRCSPH